VIVGTDSTNMSSGVATRNRSTSRKSCNYAELAMSSHLEIWSGGGNSRLSPLDLDSISIGRADTNDVALSFDPTVSRLHAVIVNYRGGWCVRDLGSANGTYLNGERLLSEQLLRPDDEIRVGATRIVFRSSVDPHLATNPTIQAGDAITPQLTKRELDVLVALCRPLLGTEAFAQPASNQTIAAELVVGVAAVKFHLGHLYDKLSIPAEGGSRRARLANEALERGIVNRARLRQAMTSMG
jgi:FHA domain